jgi:hypothetical protein
VSFDQLVSDYRSTNPAAHVRSPDIRDVVVRARRRRRRQMAGSVLGVAAAVSTGTLGLQTVRHIPPRVVADPVVNVQPATGDPHFLASTHLDLPVSFGVAGVDALWFLGRTGAGWQLEKVEAPHVTATLRVAVSITPTTLAATRDYIWVAGSADGHGELLQLSSADGSVVHTYATDGAPVAVHAVDSGTAWVTETVTGGVQVQRFDGTKHVWAKSSAVIPGAPGQRPSVTGYNRLYVDTTTGAGDTLVALDSKTLAPIATAWSVSTGSSHIRDLAYTDPLFLASSGGDHGGLWQAPFDGKSQPLATLRQLSAAPTYKVTTTKDHAWALASTADGTVLQRYDATTGANGLTVKTDVDPQQVQVLVADTHFVWLVSGSAITVYGPS